MSDSPLRVLYVARAPFVSGAERALVSMLRHLDRKHVEPGLVLGCETALVREAKTLGVPVWIVAMPKRELRGLLAWRRSLWELDRIARAFRPDVMHANDVPSCQAMSVIGDKRSIARVIHIRWGITAEDAAWFARAGSESILCISGWVRDQLGEVRDTALEGAKVEVLADAVDWAGEGENSKFKIQNSKWGKGTAVGFAGQIIETKGLDLLIEALALMPAARQPRLLVAGKDTQSGGAYEKQLRDLAAQRGVAGCIEWLGFLDDVTKLYERVTAMACPSRLEPLGLIPLEAARFGVPAFANRLGGFLETIDDGVTGRLVEPTPAAWAAALDELWDAERMARLGAAAHAATRERFSPMIYQERLMDVYTQAVSKVNSRR